MFWSQTAKHTVFIGTGKRFARHQPINAGIPGAQIAVKAVAIKTLGNMFGLEFDRTTGQRQFIALAAAIYRFIKSICRKYGCATTFSLHSQRWVATRFLLAFGIETAHMNHTVFPTGELGNIAYYAYQSVFVVVFGVGVISRVFGG